MHLTYVALHEVRWCVVVLRRDVSSFMWHQPCQRCNWVHHFGGYLKTRYKKLFTHVKSHASAMSLLESGEQRYIKAITIINPVGFQARSRGGRWSWTLKLAQKRSWAGRWSWAAKVGLLSLRVVRQRQCNGHCPCDSAQRGSWNVGRGTEKMKANGPKK